MIQTLSKLIVKTFFQDVAIESREAIPAGRPVIFVPNHPNSLLDPVLIQTITPEAVFFVAKASLFKVPVFGAILRGSGAIPVVRRFESDGAVDYSEFFETCLKQLEEGHSIVIFPEGRSLPQPYLAPLKTGPARLFFMAREKRIDACLIPVGLNYERGMVFRSSVHISIAAPVPTSRFEEEYTMDGKEAVRGLTDEIARILGENVFQAETYRDRELMLLLERLSAQDGSSDSWPDRLARLKVFEGALARLRQNSPREIEDLRGLLSRYQRLSAEFGIDPSSDTSPVSSSVSLAFAGILGMILAVAGVLLNWLPYKLVDVLAMRKDESEAATFKIIFASFVFPVCYGFEAWLLARFAGWPAALVFAICILPLSYFTLRFFEWRDELSGNASRKSRWFGGNDAVRARESLNRLRARILAEVDALASRL